jgi:hypothetical protein
MSPRAGVALVAALVALAGCAGIVGLPGQGTGPDGDAERLAFEEVATEAGIDYSTSGPNLGKGDGAALVADYDRDGDRDVLLAGGTPTLYENVGDGFEVSDALPEHATPETAKVSSGLFFDYDNDGWEDLVLLALDEAPIFLENDRGEFRVRDVGLNATLSWPMAASAADFDGDGCLDLFVAQNGDWREAAPSRDGASGKAYGHVLYRGACGGSFERVPDPGFNATHWSITASAADLTGDGKPDIHVANDFDYDVLYVNRGNGTFDQRFLANTDRHGMASEVADVNGDGRLDLFVTNIEFREPDGVWVFESPLDVVNRGNNLLLNRGNGTFVDRASDYGVRIGGWGWSGTLVDLTNDGHLDLIHATGDYRRRGTNASLEVASEPPRLWVGNGTAFEPVDAIRAGLVPTDGRGLVTFDYDGDGDRDVLVSNNVGTVRLYRNTLDGAAGNYVRVDLRGTEAQTAIGSRVYVTSDGETTAKAYTSQVNFFSQNPRTLHVGLGEDDVVERIRVVFPDGTERVVTDVPANRTVVVALDGTVDYRTPSDA